MNGDVDVVDVLQVTDDDGDSAVGVACDRITFDGHWTDHADHGREVHAVPESVDAGEQVEKNLHLVGVVDFLDVNHNEVDVADIVADAVDHADYRIGFASIVGYALTWQNSRPHPISCHRRSLKRRDLRCYLRNGEERRRTVQMGRGRTCWPCRRPGSGLARRIGYS